MNIQESNNLTTQFEEQLTTLKDQFYSVLDDYKKNYILHNMQPTSNELASAYFSDSSFFFVLYVFVNNRLIATTTDIQKNILELNTEMQKLSKKIAFEKNKEKEIKEKLSFYKGETNTTHVMIDDFTKLYFNQYISNITLGLGVIMSGYILMKTFRRQV